MMSGGKSGGSGALAAKPNLLNALRIQTSSYGQVIPIVYGQNRISGRLLWAGDFTAIPHTSTTKIGGKGLGSGGGNAITNTTYTYQTAVAIALCQGPIQNIHNVWDTKGKLALLTTTLTTTVPGTPFQITPTPPGSGIFHSPRGVSRADAFSVTNNDFGSDGSVTLSGTQQTPLTQVVSSPGPGQFSVNAGTGQHTFNTADAGKTITITYVYSVPDSNSTGVPATKISLTLFPGSRPQTPWSFLTSNHPGQDLGYNGIAYVASSAMDLGSSGTLPNLSYEVLGILPFGAGITDAEPSAVINDLITNAFYGMNSVISLGSLTQYQSFCVSNGLFLSPVLDAQQPASKCIQDILDVTNAAAVWSEGVLKIIPYGDTTAVANGQTFIPNTTPIYDITTNDLLSEVLIQRPSVADVSNSVSVEFVNRANDYNIDVAEDKDDASIALYGLRKAQPSQAHSITTANVAKFAANLIRKRMIEIRATYTLTLGWQFNLLEPMDLITLTIAELGYFKKPVRITAIRENDTGELQVDCEDFPWGTATPTLYAQQTPGGFVPQANADPGSIFSPPLIFEANDRLSLTGNYAVFIAVCGLNTNPNWGGCSVWVSPDDGAGHATTFVKVGHINGGARIGSLTALLASHADPDTVDSIAVDMSISGGQLTTGTAADCDNFRNLCWIGSSPSNGELISFQTATLVSANNYSLTTRLRRGVFSSLIGSHAIASAFVRLDDAVFVWDVDPTLVGTNIHYKFTSFNKFGLMEQSLANATDYVVGFSGMYGNINDFPTNNATIDSVVSGGGDNIRLYGPGGVGTTFTAWKRDSTSRTMPSATVTVTADIGGQPAFSSLYFVSYNFQTASYNAWGNYDQYLGAIGHGEMRIGSVTTVNAGGTGGVPGGSGSSGPGGAGHSGGSQLPRL